MDANRSKMQGELQGLNWVQNLIKDHPDKVEDLVNRRARNIKEILDKDLPKEGLELDHYIRCQNDRIRHLDDQVYELQEENKRLKGYLDRFMSQLRHKSP